MTKSKFPPTPTINIYIISMNYRMRYKRKKYIFHIIFVLCVDSLDYTGLTVDEIVQRIVPQAQNGSIILFHNGVENTAKALDRVLTELEKQGFSFVSVDDLIYKENYSIDHTGKQHNNT